MAILKKTYPTILLALMAAGLNSCYSEFDLHIDSTPVLCMNSTITPGDSIALFLTRTWAWTEGDEDKLNINVGNAEVTLIVNGEFKEIMSHRIIDNPDYPFNQYPRQLECYVSEYRPESGDAIRLEAVSTRYGEATAEVTVPYPVPIERIETQTVSCTAYGDMTGFPAVADRCQFNMRFDILAYFTDPAASTDYYDLELDYFSNKNYDGEAEAYLNSYSIIDFSGEPLLKEHVSVLESTISDTRGYTVFSDRQINGRTYPLRIGFDQLSFVYWNPMDLPGPKEFGIRVRLRHIDPSYYRHVISVWEGNDAIVGALGGVGLANPVYPYSNVSTGAGVVAAFAEATLTIPIVDIIALAEKGNFK